MTTILTAIVGSTAYGLDTPESDVDRLSIHVGSTAKVLGFGLPKGAQTMVTNKPDTTSHEVGKYVSLALRCNPTILEAMWVESHETLLSVGQELVDLREHFLSGPRVRSAYAGYAMQQADRLLRRQEAGKAGFGDVPANRTAKHGRHCYRLLLQAEQILRQGRLDVRLDPIMADVVFMMGGWAVEDPEAFCAHMKGRAHEIDVMPTLLPEHPDADLIEQWLVSTRWREAFSSL